MSEKSPAPGLNPTFDIGDSVMRARQMIDQNPSVRAANQLNTAHHDLSSQVQEQLKTIDQMSADAQIDHKTGLRNEKTWKQELFDTVETLGPNDALTVFVGDMNGFKAVNDTLGHEAGDELLALVGEAIKFTFRRESDITARGSRENDDDGSVARLGGDEFGLFSVRRQNEDHAGRWTTTPLEEALIQGNRLNDQIKQLVAGTKFETFSPSLSIGYAVRESGETADKLFARADLDMFTKKYQGKIESVSAEDKEFFRTAIPRFEAVGARVDNWIKIAVGYE